MTQATSKAATKAPAKPPARTRRTRTRQALGEALLQLLTEKSFDRITVRDITARADIGYATFFRHYPDKETLLEDLVADEIDRLLSMAVPIVFTVDTLASAQALCAYMWEGRQLWSALLTGGAATRLKAEFVDQAQALAADLAREHAWLPGDLNVVFAVSATVEILAWWLKQEAPPPVEEIATVLDRLVIAPSTQFKQD
ncbi:TetR/AcrR family transcriptional regulator [Mangrovimicrobium sediminis]|uniref:TetR/AcrR family transcriptional regulator n=1 Tax=Mangrovimicrobium sediminis TaxID=2562682 RepID=A0A4Z0M1N4_9GAMM|nr:TetR/AcrR family transcriptional regulator [Haliea sp. SAOS-164]TGD73390.1 TetR/AcrR family transcriptional regulator [Haliea sp. SAOS-164]